MTWFDSGFDLQLLPACDSTFFVVVVNRRSGFEIFFAYAGTFDNQETSEKPNKQITFDMEKMVVGTTFPF